MSQKWNRNTSSEQVLTPSVEEQAQHSLRAPGPRWMGVWPSAAPGRRGWRAWPPPWVGPPCGGAGATAPQQGHDLPGGQHLRPKAWSWVGVGSLSSYPQSHRWKETEAKECSLSWSKESTVHLSMPGLCRAHPVPSTDGLAQPTTDLQHAWEPAASFHSEQLESTPCTKGAEPQLPCASLSSHSNSVFLECCSVTQLQPSFGPAVLSPLITSPSTVAVGGPVRHAPRACLLH